MSEKWSNEKRELIRRTFCPAATDDDMSYFEEVCVRTGLDPFARHVYLTRRWDKRLNKHVPSVQTSIDGFRLTAERTGKYAGQLGPYWCGPDGAWCDIWLSSGPPSGAKVGVLRTDWKEPLWAVARYAAYIQHDKEGKVSGLWPTMADLMVAKCAEALALRRAFPNELAGLYTKEEMAQAEESPPASPSLPHLVPLVPSIDAVLGPVPGAAVLPVEPQAEPVRASRGAPTPPCPPESPPPEAPIPMGPPPPKAKKEAAPARRRPGRPTLEESRTNAVKWFGEQGLPEAWLERWLVSPGAEPKPSKDWTLEDIAYLRAIRYCLSLPDMSLAALCRWLGGPTGELVPSTWTKMQLVLVAEAWKRIQGGEEPRAIFGPYLADPLAQEAAPEEAQP